MRKNQATFISALFIAVIVCLVFFTLLPQQVSRDEGPLAEFSTKRALQHVASISDKPHYSGSSNHKDVANYIVSELEKLKLETDIQEGTTLTDWETL